MSHTLANAAIPVSIVKPLLTAALLFAWGRWACLLDKEAEYYYLPRIQLNLLQVGAAAAAFAALLLIPIYWLGLPVALALLIGAGTAFATARNRKVPEEQKWHLSMDFLRQALLARKKSAAAKEAKIRFVEGDVFRDIPLENQPEHAAHMAFEQIVVPALERRAQRVIVQIAGTQTVVQQDVDAVPYKQEAPSAAQALAMVKYLKAAAHLDVEDMRRRQIGSCRIEAGDLGSHVLQVTTSGSTRGVQMSIAFDIEAQLKRDFNDLGLLESQVAQLQPVLEHEQRVVLVASPPRNGRTTTLYALLREHDPYLLDIHTIEKRIELDLNGVSQHELDDQPMAKMLQSLLLRDPNVVMVSHIADKQTPAVIAKAGLDNKRLYVGIPGEDTFTALRAWVKALGEMNLAADSLEAIVSPRLIRKLCPACKQAYRPDASALKKLNLSADRIGELYKASGSITVDDKPQPCLMCHGLGYRGLTAIFEVLVFDDQARQLLKQGNLVPLRNHLRKNKMMLHQEAGLAKVVAGETSISEVMRVLGNPGASPS